VPNDPRPPIVTSGLRIGTPAITTRGFREAEAAGRELDRRRARRLRATEAVASACAAR
jgi:glycine/serine hydroxymethyltransferase